MEGTAGMTDRKRDDHHENKDYGPLTHDQLENIADYINAKREADLYEKIGRNVVSKTLLWVGTGLISTAAWLSGGITFHWPFGK